MQPIIEKYLTIILAMFEKDIEIMSTPWVLYTVIPMVGYLVFFFVKWAVLTAPVWMPFAIIARSFRQGVNKKEE